MGGSNRNTTLVEGGLVALAAALPLFCVPAGASPADDQATWVPKEINFVYTGFTTKYSCDGFQAKMRGILLQLGARDDLKVTRYGCFQAYAPETTPGVRIVMHVLQPAKGTAAQTVSAHWKSVDLLANRELFDAAKDCELIAQIDQQILPLFATRNVDYSARCSANAPLIGGTRLKAEVLLADSGAAAAPRGR
ncbi:MAG TPA: hypothetical protein VGR86_08470 [Steroidobacteraceae bacterium]|nr:hypothetical protein [Steroidobacteraceae bacterium]